MILLFSSATYSQYLINENFNQMSSGQYIPPTGWVFGQGDFPTLTNYNYSSGWKGKDFGNVTDGLNEVAIAVNIYGTSRRCWAISPAVDLSSTSTKELSFDAALTNFNSTAQGSFDTNDDSIFVAYSLDGGFTWNYSQILKVFKGGDVISASGEPITIDLTSIGSETNVSFAFYGVSRQTGNDVDFFVDNVKVGGSSAYDMEATSIISPSGVIISNSPEVKAVFSNTGLNPISGKYYARILDPNSAQVFYDSVSFSNSAVNEIDTVSFGQVSLSINGTYTMRAIAIASGDLNNNNDSISTNFNVSLSTNNLVVVYDNSSAQELENKAAVFNALNSLGISYDSLDRSSSTPNFTPWKEAIWCEEGDIPQAERNAIISFLNAGTSNNQKVFLIAGDDIGFNHGRAGQPGYDSIFYSYYLHAKYFADDVSTLFNNYGIVGQNVNSSLHDSLNSEYPDAIGTKFGGVPAYMFGQLPALSDTVAGVAFDGPTYNIIYYPFEFREVITNVTPNCKQLISGSLDWLTNAAGNVPVELESFSAKAIDRKVSLSWITATETNNSGFAIERKDENNSFKQIAFVKGNGTTTGKSSYSYKDENLTPGNYAYRLRQVDFDGSFKLSNESLVEINSPRTYTLDQNYPNPFNPSTTIKFSIPNDEFVSLTIHNILGEKVATLINNKISAGDHEVNFNASNLASGVYVYILSVENDGSNSGQTFLSTKKMILMK